MGTDAEVVALADRIAEALRRETQPESEGCQRLVVSLVSEVGWQRARQLVLARVHRGRVWGRA